MEGTNLSARRKRRRLSSDEPPANTTTATNNDNDVVEASDIPSTGPTTSVMDNVQCGICFTDVIEEQGILNSCTHTFCFPCIFEWSQVTNTCPFWYVPTLEYYFIYFFIIFVVLKKGAHFTILHHFALSLFSFFLFYIVIMNVSIKIWKERYYI